MPVARILFVEASVGGVVGGSLTGIQHLIRRLDRSRFAPELLLYEDKPTLVRELERDGVRVHVLPPLPQPTSPRGFGRFGRAVLQVRELVRVVRPRSRAVAAVLADRRPGLVYLANGITANLDAALAAGHLGIPLLCHEKGFRRIGPIERWASRRIDVTVCMTDEIRAHYAAHGVRARRLVTVFDGIDCDAFSPGGGASVRRALGIPEDAPVVGIVGHIQEWKGQHLVVEAVAEVRKTHPALRCLVVGGVHRQGTAYGESLARRVGEPDLAGHVILTGERADVPACLDAMDVAIHASITPEPFGRVLIEAMALGRPLIAPREGGPLVIVADGETGLLVEPRSAPAIAAAIRTLLDEPERRVAMGRAARARVDAVFDIRHHVARMEELFDEAMAGRSR